MSSSDSHPPEQQRVSEAESDEDLSEGDETGGEMQVAEGPSSPAAAHSQQHREGPPSRSQSLRNHRCGRPASSQRAPDADMKALMWTASLRRFASGSRCGTWLTAGMLIPM
ncbi:uncharacterized protein LOC143807320 [Ranitomeya variabilis]|uniref:uncharacterized protein LOC143807320 n=1 Tax=Ranitomeya variabilis TaxID=490064 RepID=UPI004056DA59